LASVRDSFVTASGRKVALAIYVEPGKEDRCSWAMESLKRAMRWDEERFGREYDLDVFNIVAVSDFNMGAMENKGLNIFNDKLVLARPGYRERRRLRLDRGRHRARIFPQLVGRPRHVPRLVPALPEGGSDRLPRPGVHRRHTRGTGAKRIAAVRMLKTHHFPRTLARLPIPVRPHPISRSTTSIPATVYEKGAESLPHVADAARPRRLPQRARPLFRAP
jgi:aminopeptidase N